MFEVISCVLHLPQFKYLQRIKLILSYKIDHNLRRSTPGMKPNLPQPPTSNLPHPLQPLHPNFLHLNRNPVQHNTFLNNIFQESRINKIFIYRYKYNIIPRYNVFNDGNLFFLNNFIPYYVVNWFCFNWSYKREGVEILWKYLKKYYWMFKLFRLRAVRVGNERV